MQQLRYEDLAEHMKIYHEWLERTNKQRREESVEDVALAARRALEAGMSEVDLCFLVEGVCDAFAAEMHEELERAAS